MKKRVSLFSTVMEHVSHKHLQIIKILGLALLNYFLISMLLLFFLSGLLYIWYATNPAHLLIVFKRLKTEPGFSVMMWMMPIIISFYYFLALFSAILTHIEIDPQQPHLKVLPVFKLLGVVSWLALCLAIPMVLSVQMAKHQFLALMLGLMTVFIHSLNTAYISITVPEISMEAKPFLTAVQSPFQQIWEKAPDNFRQLLIFAGILSFTQAVFSGLIWLFLPALSLPLVSVTGVLYLIIPSPLLVITGFLIYKDSHPVRPTIPIRRPYYPLLIGLTCGTLLLFWGLDQYNHPRVEQLKANQREKIAAQRPNNRFEREVLRGAALPGNGAEAYWQLIGKTKTEVPGVTTPNFRFAEQDEDAFKGLQDKAKRFQIIPDAGLIHKYREALNRMRQATQHAYVDFKPEFTLEALLPDLIMIQKFGRLLLAQAIQQCQSHHCPEGGEIFLDTLRMGQDISAQGTLISAMIGIVLKNTAIHSFGPYITATNFKSEELQSLLLQLAKLLKAEQGLSNPLRNEILTFQSMMLAITDHETYLRHMSTGEENLWDDTVPSKVVQKLMMVPEAIDAVQQLDEINSLLTATLKSPYDQVRLQLQELFNDVLESIESNELLNIMMPNIQDTLQRSFQNQALLNGFYMHVALQAYFAKYHHYPNHLAALTPEIIPVLLPDLYTGKNLIYKYLSPTDYRLYSVGEDETDDGGKGFYTLLALRDKCVLTDIVFAPTQPQMACGY